MKPQGFPKTLRLSRKSEMDAVFAAGRFVPLGAMRAKAVPTDRPEGRFFFSVSKKVGTAPERNRIKRLMREAVRKNRGLLAAPHDLCLYMTKAPQHPLTLDYVERQVRRLFEELGRPAQPARPAPAAP